MKKEFYIVLLGAFAFGVRAQEVRVTGAEVTEVGIYTAQVIQVTTATNLIDQRLDGLDGFELLESTTNVPARIGTRFGFRYRISGQPENAPIVLTMIGVHPQFTNPATGVSTNRDEYQLNSWIGHTFTSYNLDEEWELISGRWTFEVWHDGKKLCDQSFMVVPDEERKSANQRPRLSP